jgi:cell division protein FtsI/penicillin-binding protein 2
MYDFVIMARTFSFVAALLLGALTGSAARAQTLRGDTIRLAGPRYVAELANGGRADLTLDPRLQTSTEDVLRTFRIPYGAAVVLSVSDGRVLAMVGRSAVDPQLGVEELALRPWAPAASVFKVVSATALVESGLSGASRTCYHGGVSSILPDNLLDLPALDQRCGTLAFGLGKSQNAIFAKLATRHLTTAALARIGRSFGFEEPIPFELPVEPSQLEVPADALEFARTAAGFWHSTLSPMHGALLAATIARGGQMPTPTLIERATAADGRTLALPVATLRHVVDRSIAAEVGRMMELTTRIGTAKGTFRNKRGQRYLPVEVAGKTGTLSADTDRGYVGYSWFVGYAPADKPAIAFAVALGQSPNWRIKATYVGRHIVSEYLAERAGERAAPRLLAAR